MVRKLLLAVVVLALLVLAIVYGTGIGLFGEDQHAGTPSAPAVSQAVVDFKIDSVRAAGLDVGVARPKQILFGDLHVHSTFSFDAFTLSLPMAGGDGAHPVSDACDYARHCSSLDFWSINDHAITLTPRRWRETVDAIRQCNAVAGSDANPDLVTYLGWEWTQVGATPETHYGHKNVVVRGLDDVEIPTRPIAAGLPLGIEDINAELPSPFVMGAYGLYDRARGGVDFANYQAELMEPEDCPRGVPVRELPSDCRESAATPGELFAKLDDWGFDSLVIPHGTTWGFYTPLGSSWDKQLTSVDHDPDRQKLIEVFSGHGNSEEFRPFEEVVFDADGRPSCPEPAHGFLPTCWRAGELIEERCLAEEGTSPEACADRAARARQLSVEASNNGGTNVVTQTEVVDWQDAGQCRDCFQPSFNYRPRSSVQYIMALGRDDGTGGPFRFDFGFIAASDNHSARPGTGYKEVARTEFTEQRFGSFVDTPIGAVYEQPEYSAEPVPFEFDPSSAGPLSAFEVERAASFFLNGGLAAVHADGRDRDAIWQAMERKEVYGTSGPRILLWFDLLNSPGRLPSPMGSQVELGENPIFQVKAVGSFQQNPGCGPDATQALGPERLARLCQGECYNPSTQRRAISRIEIIRIRPQREPNEAIVGLVEDPWKVIPCEGDPAGCVATFVDEDYVSSGRDVLYYARAIEEPSEAVAADPLGCRRDAEGRCVQVDPCFGRPDDDECLAQTEERAWSSPIFVNQVRRTVAMGVLRSAR